MNFFNSNPLILNSLLSIILSTLLLFFHSRKFRYLLNRSTIYLTLMLPVTILVLTQTIATNLYLSLGLIGALSIVRYRTPVKSQYELAYLFALIAIGIVTGVNAKYAFLLTVFLIIIPAILELSSKFIPAIASNEMRFNSDGKAEITLIINAGDYDKVNKNPTNGKLIRIDENYQENQGIFFFIFDSFEDANKFRKQFKFIPISISISNS